MNNSVKEFLNNRFGLFMHFGAYSVASEPDGGEWIRSTKQLTIDDYQTYVDQFNPVDFDPVEIAKKAKSAGFKYAVMTAKHHDGFCLFDSKLTDYSTANTINRDLVQEYVTAFRNEGLNVGIYYSLLDWHHPDFPEYGDIFAPNRNNESRKNVNKNFDNYLKYLHGQVRELMTNYGDIDNLWLDFSYKNNPDSGLPDMTDSIWHADELVKMIRELQPNVVINNRLQINDINTQVGDIKYGDYTSPEQIIPPETIKDNQGNLVPWEACITINDHWGFVAQDHNYKSAQTLIYTLAECVSKNGNLIINVAPDARGNFSTESESILSEIADWMEINQESIIGCTNSFIEEKPDWGWYTQKGDKLYAHIFERGIGPIRFQGLAGKVDYAQRVDTGADISLSTPWQAEAFKNDLFYDMPENELPNRTDFVLMLHLKDYKG